MNKSGLVLIALMTLFLVTTISGQVVEAMGGGEKAQTVLDTIILALLALGTFIALDLYNIMKGGELAMSWGYMSGAVAIFALIKMIELGGKAEFFPVPETLISVGQLFVAFFLLLGFLKQRKTLK